MRTMTKKTSFEPKIGSYHTVVIGQLYHANDAWRQMKTNLWSTDHVVLAPFRGTGQRIWGLNSTLKPTRTMKWIGFFSRARFQLMTTSLSSECNPENLRISCFMYVQYNAVRTVNYYYVNLDRQDGRVTRVPTVLCAEKYEFPALGSQCTYICTLVSSWLKLGCFIFPTSPYVE